METSNNERIGEVIFFLKKTKKVRNTQQFCEEIGANKTIISRILHKKLQVTNKLLLIIITNKKSILLYTKVL